MVFIFQKLTYSNHSTKIKLRDIKFSAKCSYIKIKATPRRRKLYAVFNHNNNNKCLIVEKKKKGTRHKVKLDETVSGKATSFKTVSLI